MAKEMKILCVNLPEHALELFQNCLQPGMALQRIQFSDYEKIKTEYAEYRAVYFHWDGLTQKAHRLIGELRRGADKFRTRLNLIITEDDRNLEYAKKNVKADFWCDIRTEVHRLEANLYDVAFDVYDNDRKNLETQSASSPLAKINQPPIIPPDMVLKRVREFWAARDKSMVKNRKVVVLDPKTQTEQEVIWPRAESVVFLRPQVSAALKIQEFLETLQFTRVLLTEKTQAAANHIRDHGCAWLIIWLTEEYSAGLNLLSELHEYRELRRFAITFVFPGENAVKFFLEAGATTFHDSVGMAPRDEKGMEQICNKTFSAFANPNTATSKFFHFRAQWQQHLAAKPVFDEAQFKTYQQIILNAPGNKKPWFYSDAVLYFLAKGNVTNAEIALNELFKHTNPEWFDALYLDAIVAAKKASVAVGAQKLLELAQKHEQQLTPGRYFRIGMALARWQRAEELLELLLRWDKTAETDHQIWYLAARYCQITGPKSLEKVFLYPAIDKAPGRGQYLQEMAQLLVRSGDHVEGAKYWQFAARGTDTNPLACLTQAAKELIAGKKLVEAQTLLTNLAARYPNAKEVGQLKDKVGHLLSTSGDAA
jgi:hypothetical protein